MGGFGGTFGARRRGRRFIAIRATAALGAAALVSAAGMGAVPAGSQTSATSWPADVFAVGTFDGVAGQYTTIQTAVDAAEQWATANTVGSAVPATYVLVGPGDYKTNPAAIDPPPAGAPPAGVLVDTPNLWLVGMSRSGVVVDGTQGGPPCSTAPGDQAFGTAGSPTGGLNGIMVWKAAGVWVENMTVCNFLAGTAPGGTGNEVWWNGGADSWHVFTDPAHPGAPAGYWGSYLTTTSTYFHDEATAAQYGIFSSNWDGGIWRQSYASNFNDSGFYIGACQQQCNQTMDGVQAEFNALGYSGSNSGGNMLIEHSRFDQNADGFDTNSQNGDNPPPQDGSCPGNTVSPVTHTHSCWVFMDNLVDDNNDSHVPGSGFAGGGPLGTGMSLSGARNDTVMHNTFTGNDAWGTILVPFPDSGPPCTGGTQLQAVCVFDEWGDAVVGNTYAHNGAWRNPTNGDIGAVNLEPGPTDCFSGNTDTSGPLTTSPPLVQVLYPACTGATVPPDANALFADEVACDAGSIAIGPVPGSTLCPPGANYPPRTTVVLQALPGATAGTYGGQPVPAIENPSSSTLPTDPDPCQGVPANPWCPAGA